MLAKIVKMRWILLSVAIIMASIGIYGLIDDGSWWYFLLIIPFWSTGLIPLIPTKHWPNG